MTVSIEKPVTKPTPKVKTKRDPVKDVRNLTKYLGIFIMKRIAEVAAVATIIILLPMTGMAEDNAFTSQYKQDSVAAAAAGEVEAYQEEKQGFFSKSWNNITHKSKAVFNSAQGVLDPDQRNKDLRTKIDILNKEIKELRTQKMVTRVQDTVEWEKALACLPIVARIVERAEPLSSEVIKQPTHVTHPSVITGPTE